MLLADLPSTIDIDTVVRYGDFLSGLEVGILSHAPDGAIEYANDIARGRLGFHGLSGLGLDNTWALCEADGGHLALSELPAVKALCLGRAVRGRVVGCLLGGELHLLRMDAMPVSGRDGHVARVVTAFRDVTPPAVVQEAAEAADRAANQA
ncbi:PAS domain-containing protein [Aromatoleum toluclasticum]|uniref:hypothetical protein n=1 Tax=Aromatoleum toluclasticum TaxID=92003 RepID=UPI00036C5BF3|nr:hypothetical protein [Aromatoleum toluclasticum]